jgi:CHRD domain-containing protein
MKANRLFVTCVAAMALVACGGTKDFTATMTGAAEKPNAVSTSGTGTATLKLDGMKATVDGSFSGLSSNATAAHIHGPADASTTADVICTLTVPQATSGSISGSCDLTDAQVTALEDGKLYVNVHTANNAPGEIRGQLAAK